MFVVLVVYVVWQTYPNYDTYYTLVWGKELANGHLPDYDVFARRPRIRSRRWSRG